MASVTMEVTQPKPQLQAVPKKQIVPVKMGFMGEQGVGKTTTAALMATAISKLYHAGAPVHVTDPELGWQFLEPVIFRKEGIQLVQRTVPTFKAMLGDLRDAEREGACVWNVELGKIWIEILKTLQKAKPASWGSELNYMWTDFVNHFLNSKLHCIVLGRIQDVLEDVVDEEGKIRSLKTGEGMKAGGQRNNFGYEPHIVIRMYREQRNRVKKGKLLEAEGRVVHRAEVTKDRTWALNGKVFRWPDRDGYKTGDYKYVWDSLKPHFLAVQETMSPVKLDTIASSSDLIGDDGHSEYFRNRERRDVLVAELSATLDLLWGGQGKEEKRLRKLVGEAIFGVLTQEAWEKMSLEKIERGVHIVQAFRKRCQADGLPDTELSTLNALNIDITEFDEGTAEESDLPF